MTLIGNTEILLMVFGTIFHLKEKHQRLGASAASGVVRATRPTAHRLPQWIPPCNLSKTFSLPGGRVPMFLLVLQEIKSHKTLDYPPSNAERSWSYWCNSQQYFVLRSVLSCRWIGYDISEKPVVPSTPIMQKSRFLRNILTELKSITTQQVIFYIISRV